MTYPKWYIAKPCKHWTAAKNRRYRLYRIDGPADHVGRYPGKVFNSETEQMQSCSYGISMSDMSRPAEPHEIPDNDLFRRAI